MERKGTDMTDITEPVTKSEFIELLNRLAVAANVEEKLWEYKIKECYLSYTVEFLIETLWINNIENEDVELLRYHINVLRSTGHFPWTEVE